jgi:TonB family protein
MEWRDDEFEAMLRRFRPVAPKPLGSASRRSMLTVGAAAGVAAAVTAVAVAAVVIPMRNTSRRVVTGVSAPQSTPRAAPPANLSGTQSASPAYPNATPNRGTTAHSTQTETPKRDAVPSNSPTLSNGPAEPRLAAPISKHSAATGTGAVTRVRAPQTVRPPRKIVDVQAEYPADARAAQVEGVVILAIVIGDTGSVIEVRAIKSIPELDQAAIDAVQQWVFEPTYLDGEAVEVEMNVVVNFTLHLQ